MQVKNTSARLVTVGETIIVPGETVEINDAYHASVVGSRSLEIVGEPVKRTRKTAAVEKAVEQPVAETESNDIFSEETNVQ